MADVNLTQQEIDYIARVVDTEVPGYLARSNPAEYERMVQGVVDTVTNRIESERFPNTALGVLDQNRQFSKISGPSRLGPYGSAARAPKASPLAENAVYDYVAARAQGAPPTVGGALNYANPNFSDRSNLTSWINPMIERGATALGIGKSVHQHGTVPGMDPVGFYTMAVEGMPSGPVPTPTPRDAIAPAYGIMGAIDPVAPMPVERGGLLGPASIPAAITPGPVEYGGLLGAPSMPGQAGKTGRVGSPSFDAGRFGPAVSAVQETPVAAFAPAEAPPAFDPGRFGPQIQAPTAPSSVLGRFAETQPVAQGMAGLQRGLLDQQLSMGILPSIPSPIDPTKTAAVPGYVDPMVRSQPQVQAPAIQEVPQQPAPPQFAAQPGITAQPAQPAMSAAQRTFNERSAMGAPAPSLLGPQMARDAQRGMGQRNMLGGIGGALLGGALLGPVGGLLGGMLGRSYAQRTYSPPAPEPIAGQPRGTAPGGGVSVNDLNDYGRETYSSSGDFRDAIDAGGIGLY